MSSRKQSILVGGLISSMGIFVSKIFGLLYTVAYYPIIGTLENRTYYSQSYNIYSYLLNIATAGLPFAIATIVARYASRNDYKTALLVRRISTITMATFGFVAMLAMMGLSPLLANNELIKNAGDYQTVLMVLSSAVFVVPILSSVRGFYQGLKEMELYSTSQVYEQLIRIAFLLIASAISVYVFKLDRIVGVYMGVLAASISAAATIFYMQRKGKKRVDEVKYLASIQENKTKISSQSLFKELIVLAIPFFLNALFGYSDTLINQLQLGDALAAGGVKPDDIIVYGDAVFSFAAKVIAIPMVLAPGFSSAIIPYLTTALEQHDIKQIRKHIVECLETVVYITLPILLAIFVFAEPILYTLFPGSAEHMGINAYVLRWYTIEGLFATIVPVTTILVMSVGERKRIVLHTFLFAVIKVLINYKFIEYLGVEGMVLSSAVAYTIMLVLNLLVLQQKYHINWTYFLRRLLFVFVGLLGFFLLAQVFGLFGWIGYGGSRIIALLKLGFMGVSGLLVYFVITAIFHIPQIIFHVDIKGIINRIRGIK